MTEEIARPSPRFAGLDPTRRRRPLALLWDWLVASDPAYASLRLTTRAMGSLVAAGLLLAGFTFLVRILPIAAYGMAVVTAFLGSMAATDRTWQQQSLTRAAMFGAGIVTVLLASVLAPDPLVADVGFLVVAFAAAWVRKFAARGFAAGMMMFMAYFMGDYLKPEPADIGWIAFAMVVTLAVTHVFTVWLVPSNPERDFRRAVSTIEGRIDLILARLGSLAYGKDDPLEAREALLRQSARLHAMVLVAEGFIPQGAQGELAASSAASDLAVTLFDLQLAVERLIRASARALPGGEIIDAILDRDAPRIRQEVIALRRLQDDAGDQTITRRALMRVYRARRVLRVALRVKPSPAFAALPAPAMPPNTAAGAGSGGVPASLQLPIQITLACLLAMIGGNLISSSRWYWAVLTAFIVFNNAKSRADTTVRALQRVAGTLAGLFAGTAAATLLQGQLVASGIGVLVLFAIAFYLLQVSYGVMIFFITIALALLYGMMGQFTPELLVLRLEETAIGGLSGIIVAFLVFPQRASHNVDAVIDTYLKALGELVAASRTRVDGEASDADLLALSRRLDRRYGELAIAVRPLGGPWSVVTRYGQVREKLLVLNGVNHWAHALARSLSKAVPVDAGTRQRVDALSDEIEQRLAAAAQLKSNVFLRAAPLRPGAPGDAARRRLAPSAEGDPVFSLEVIADLLGRAVQGEPAQTA